MSIAGLAPLTRQNVAGKDILLRADLNLPFHDGNLLDATRLDQLVATIGVLRDLAAENILVISHRGRPGGKRSPEHAPKYSLAPILAFLEQKTGEKTGFVAKPFHPDVVWPQEKLWLLENLRFVLGEENNCLDFARNLARLGQIYVNDAFSCCHNAHASIALLPNFLPAFAGPNLAREYAALSRIFTAPPRPVMAVVGGAKIDSKIAVLEHLSCRMDMLVIGGAMANVFLCAKGAPAGAMAINADQIAIAKRIMQYAKQENCQVILPKDGVMAEKLAPDVACRICPVSEIRPSEFMFDLGPQTSKEIGQIAEQCAMIVWNGPLGAFETAPFDRASVAFARVVSQLTRNKIVQSIAGGGDTLAVLRQAGALSSFGHVSTGGGAFLTWLCGEKMPGIEALRQNRQSTNPKASERKGQ